MIEAYEFGSVVVNGVRYTSDLIIYPDRVDAGWWRREGHSLYPEDIQEALAIKPEVLIIGCGASGILKVPDSTRRYIESCGVELQALPTAEACKLYNKLHKEKRVVAGLHLTC